MENRLNKVEEKALKGGARGPQGQKGEKGSQSPPYPGRKGDQGEKGFIQNAFANYLFNEVLLTTYILTFCQENVALLVPALGQKETLVRRE